MLQSKALTSRIILLLQKAITALRPLQELLELIHGNSKVFQDLQQQLLPHDALPSD